jgi:small GTP-binding protein
VARFVHNVYSEKYQTTIGVKVDTKIIETSGTSKKLVIWDIAGRNKFGNVEFTYLRGSAGYLLIVDGTRETTLDTALALRKSIEARYGEIPYVLVINKADLTEQWAIEQSRIDQLTDNGVPVFITSAKTGERIEEAFEKLSTLVS